MINIENVGKRLRMVREFFKFTQQKMADVLQMNLTYSNVIKISLASLSIAFHDFP